MVLSTIKIQIFLIEYLNNMQDCYKRRVQPREKTQIIKNF